MMDKQLAAALAEMTRLKLRVDNAEIAWREESTWANNAESRANKAESLAKNKKVGPTRKKR
jgi:muramoyltetrapeptide carboxypeptidase LdcA involved in peptidoglycan recycling